MNVHASVEQRKKTQVFVSKSPRLLGEKGIVLSCCGRIFPIWLLCSSQELGRRHMLSSLSAIVVIILLDMMDKQLSISGLWWLFP